MALICLTFRNPTSTSAMATAAEATATAAEATTTAAEATAAEARTTQDEAPPRKKMAKEAPGQKTKKQKKKALDEMFKNSCDQGQIYSIIADIESN
jgi:hypothetical protein